MTYFVQIEPQLNTKIQFNTHPLKLFEGFYAEYEAKIFILHTKGPIPA